MKTDELTGAALDWAVAKCEGWIDDCSGWLYQATLQEVAEGNYKPSTDWAQGGAIIERERITVAWNMTRWVAWTGVIEHKGETPLIAAMRCYVSGELGSEVDIPDELMKTAGGY